MFLRLFLLFTLIPIVEVTLLVKIGEHFGFLATLSLVIFTGLLGSYLVRQQGFRVWYDIQYQMRQGQFPADGLIDGLLLLIAGVVLVTPGLLTDTAGFVLLIPSLRTRLKGLIKKKIEEAIAQGRVQINRNR